MFTTQMEKVANILIEKKISKSEDKDLVVHGLSIGLELCFNIITTIILGYLFGMVLESIVFLVSFSFIRTYAGGYHCQKAINCYFLSSGIVILVLTIVKFTPKEYIFSTSMILLFFLMPIFIKLAPMETLSKPFDEEERKYYRKKTVIHLCIECTVILILFLNGLQSLGFVVCLGLMVSAGLVFLQTIIS